MYRGTAHVVLGSALTIAGAVYCLSFTRMPYFQSLGVPAAIGVCGVGRQRSTLAPAMLILGSHFGLFEPKRTTTEARMAPYRYGHRALAGPILVASCAVALIGLLALPGYKTSYDVSSYMPATAPSPTSATPAAETPFLPRPD